MEGSGMVTAGSEAFSLPVTFPRRIGEPEGMTSPEELMAAAHAACYAMALSATVGRRGGTITKTRISCKVTAEKGDAGIKIHTSALTVVAEGLKGIELADFPEVAKAAEAACPVSNAYRGSLKITLDAVAK